MMKLRNEEQVSLLQENSEESPGCTLFGAPAAKKRKVIKKHNGQPAERASLLVKLVVGGGEHKLRLLKPLHLAHGVRVWVEGEDAAVVAIVVRGEEVRHARRVERGEAGCRVGRHARDALEAAVRRVGSGGVSAVDRWRILDSDVDRRRICRSVCAPPEAESDKLAQREGDDDTAERFLHLKQTKSYPPIIIR